MRFLSHLFQPVITIPKNAKIKNTEITCKSQKLLLECGLIRPTSTGLITLLPLACRAVDKLEKIIKRCVEEVGAQRITLPSLTASSLWEQSGRLQDVGPELLRVTDRHDKHYILAPTFEEAIADLLVDTGPLSYKQLPLILYQMSNKYRDEMKAKHGLLRSRQFSMLDAYGIHATKECAETVYDNMSRVYTKIFNTLELPVYSVQAPSGDMGGNLSHEWQLPAEAGEDSITMCPSCSNAMLSSEKEADSCGRCGKRIQKCSSIEVGHTFILGTRYSEPLKANFVPASGTNLPLIMSCYGIGITRLMAASIEALSSEKSLRWPKTIAPFTTIVIGPKEGSKEWQVHGVEATQRVCEVLSAASPHQDDLLLDDRHHMTIGKRLMMADKMGYPYIVVCGRSATENPPRYELYRSVTGKEASVQLMGLDEIAYTIAGGEGKFVERNKL